MCAILQLVSAPSNPRPIVDQVRSYLTVKIKDSHHKPKPFLCRRVSDFIFVDKIYRFQSGKNRDMLRVQWNPGLTIFPV